MVQKGTIDGKDVVIEKDQYGTWVAVMNYEHYQNNDPNVSPGSTFPQLPNGKTNSSDIQNKGSNGELKHVDAINQYGSTWDNVDAVKLEATTENHSRKIHYFTENQNVIDAVVTSQSRSEAGASDLKDQTTFYSDHTANLPDAGSNQTTSNSERIFGYEFPMYQPGEYHWALSGDGNRWEVDDFPDDDSNSTVHRVWVRVPDGTFNLQVNLSETFSVNGFSNFLKKGAVTQIFLTEELQGLQDSITLLSKLSSEFTLIELNGDGNAQNKSLIPNEKGGVTYGSGKFGQAFQGDNTDAFIQYEPSVNILNDWYNGNSTSISLWFKTTNTEEGLFGVAGAARPSDSNGWVPGIYIGTNGYVNCSIFWHGDTKVTTTSNTYNDGNWHQVTAVFDSSKGEERLYIDGDLEAARTGLSQNNFNSGSYYYYLGAVRWDGWPNRSGNTGYMSGQIDRFRVFNAALNDIDAQKLYTNDTSQIFTQALSEQPTFSTAASTSTQRVLAATSQIKDTTTRKQQALRTNTADIQVQEAFQKQLEKPVSQTVSVNDTLINKILIKLSETTTHSDTAVTLIDKKQIETISTSAQTTKKLLTALNQSLSTSTVQNTKFTGFRNLGESLNILKRLKKELQSFRSISEQIDLSTQTESKFTGFKTLQASIGLSDTIPLRLQKTKKENLDINDAETSEAQLERIREINIPLNDSDIKQTGKKVSETVNTSDISATQFQGFRTLTETLTTSVNLQKSADILRKVQENIPLTDTQTSLAKIQIIETLQITANTQIQSNFFRQINETLNINDSDIKQISKTVSQAFPIRDNQNSTAELSRTQTENLNLEETSTTAFSGLRTLKETTGLNDDFSEKAELFREAEENLNNFDTSARKAEVFRTKTETLSVQEDISPVYTGLRAVSETATLQDTEKLTALKSLNEMLTFQDITTRLFNGLRTFTETFDLNDSDIKQTGKKLSERMKASDRPSSKASLFRKSTENLQMQGNTAFRDLLSLNETADLNSNLSKTAELLRENSESLNISESAETQFDALRTLSETANLQENRANKTLKKITETKNINTEIQKVHDGKRQLAESLTVQESDIKQISKTLSKNTNLNDSTKRKASLFRTKTEALIIQDNISVIHKALRNISETIALQDAIKTEAKHSRKQSETLTSQVNLGKTIQQTLTETNTVLDSIKSNLVQTVKKVNPTVNLNISPITQKEAKLFRKFQETFTISDNKTLGGVVQTALRRIELKRGLVENLAETLRTFNEANALNAVNSYSKQTSPRHAETQVNANKYKSEKRKHNSVEQK